jgi:Ras family
VADGRSCLLHRFLKGEWKGLTSHTIGVEFANKIVKMGSGTRRKRMKLQVQPKATPTSFGGQC